MVDVEELGRIYSASKTRLRLRELRKTNKKMEYKYFPRKKQGYRQKSDEPKFLTFYLCFSFFPVQNVLALNKCARDPRDVWCKNVHRLRYLNVKPFR